MKRVFISGPYSADNVMDVLRNIREGIHISYQVLQLGMAPFCPWLDYQYVLMDHFNLLNIEDFYNYSLAWLEASDAILMTGNWTESRGCLNELQFATDHLIPVFTNLNDLILWNQK